MRKDVNEKRSIMPKRCPNGSRRDKTTKECIPKSSDYNARKRCPNGSRRDKTTKECIPKKNINTLYGYFTKRIIGKGGKKGGTLRVR